MGELIDTVKGKVKQAEGRATGNKAKEAEGLVDELKGKVKGRFEEAKTDVKRAVRERRDEKRATSQRGKDKTVGRANASSSQR